MGGVRFDGRNHINPRMKPQLLSIIPASGALYSRKLRTVLMLRARMANLMLKIGVFREGLD